MKRTFILIAAVLSVLTVLNLPAAEKSIVIGKDNVMTLNSGNAEIVVAPQASKVTLFAAAELKQFLDEVLKSDVKIVKSPTAGKKHFFIGKEFAQAAGFDEKKLFRDAFYIVNRADGIYIGGIDDRKADPIKQLHRTIWAQYYERGTIFGVYDWLERFAGVRFYFPGKLGTIVPAANALDVPQADIFDFPDYDVRRYSMYQGKWMDEPKSPEALARYNKNRDKNMPKTYRRLNYGEPVIKRSNDYRNEEKNLMFYRTRMETFMEPNCHGLARYCYVERFGKDHPEYFALKENGQRHVAGAHYGSICYSSNIVEEIYQDAKSYLSGEKASKRGVLTVHSGKPGWDPSACQPGYFNIMPQDSYYRCRCEKCAAKFGTGVNYATEFMWKFTVDIANRLKAEGVPGKITQMAYRPYRAVPKTVEIPDNVSVMVAEIGPWGQYNPAGQARDYKEIAAWCQKVAPNRIYLWNYCGKYGPANIPDIPSPVPKALALYYKSLNSLKIRGAYVESENDRYLNNYLMYYVYGKLAWDNNVDTDAMIAEHHQLMFGSAAKVMTGIFDDLEYLWLAKMVAKQAETDRGPLVSVPGENEVWNSIYSEKFLKGLRERFDEAEKLTAGDKLANQRVKLFRREWLEPLAAMRAKYIEQSDIVSKFSFTLNKPFYLRSFSQNKAVSENTQLVQTQVTVNIGNDTLRVSFECEEPDMKNIIAVKRPRNDPNIWQDNSVEVFINPNGDDKTFYQFILNTQNSVSGSFNQLNGSTQKKLHDVKAGIYTVVKPTPKGFRAAFSIPVKQLKNFDPAKAKFNFSRNRILDVKKDYATLYTWSPFVKRFNDMENFGKCSKAASNEKSYVDSGDFSAPQKTRWIGKWFHEVKLQPNQSVRRDTVEYFSYPASLRINNDNPAKLMYVCQYLNMLEPNSEYELTCLVKCKDIKRNAKSSSGGFMVNINVEKNAWFPKNGILGTGNWTQLKYRFKTTAKSNNPHRCYIRFYLNGATGTAWIDDVVIRKIK